MLRFWITKIENWVGPNLTHVTVTVKSQVTWDSRHMHSHTTQTDILRHSPVPVIYICSVCTLFDNPARISRSPFRHSASLQSATSGKKLQITTRESEIFLKFPRPEAEITGVNNFKIGPGPGRLIFFLSMLRYGHRLLSRNRHCNWEWGWRLSDARRTRRPWKRTHIAAVRVARLVVDDAIAAIQTSR